ncbi:alanine--glyoxylate aminotransferase 2, mitochondrial-like [Oscarella lobularis]|uniref:alanine--glyoxylate aminotransferase 2, mitochondrial-like n=1 Tax=Oscarella lobularis TaxID=121494 RepID=UPI003313CD91
MLAGAFRRITKTAASAFSTTAAATNLPQMPPCDFTPKPFDGMSKARAKEVRATHLSPAMLTFYKDPVYVHQGHKQWLFDSDGKRYLDLFAGIVTVGVGHCHPTVLKAVVDQQETLWHTTNIYMHPKIHEYAERLTATLPDYLDVVYLVNSGSEANDLAMAMARLYTGKYDIVSLRNAYHGLSTFAMGATSLGNWMQQMPTRNGLLQSMNADVYRGPWGGSNCREESSQVVDRTCDCSPGECKASDMYAGQLEDVLKHCTPKKIAGFIVEYIQGVGGCMQLPRGFISKAFELIRAKGGLCILDEVQTGFGRMGTHFWGFEAAGCQPDIIVMAKSIANGFPMGAVVTRKEIAASLTSALHLNTFGGNPMACAAATAVLDVMEEEKLQSHALDLGRYTLRKMEELRDKYPIIGDVRGRGLMLGMELVSDRETRTPLAPEIVANIFEDCKDMGILFGKGGLYGSCFRIKPPLCVTKEDIDFAMAVMDIAFQKHQPQA